MRFRTVARAVAVCLAVLGFCLGLALFALGLGWLNGPLRDFVQGRLGRALEVPVQIGALEGNPLAHFRLVGVRAGAEAKPLLLLDTLSVRYRPAALLRGRLEVTEARLSAPKVWVRQAEPGGPAPDRPEARPAGPPPLAVRVQEVAVAGGELHISTPGFQDRIREVDMAFGFRADRAGYALELQRFRSALFEPALAISNLTGVTLLEGGRLTLKRLRLQTAGSDLRIDGVVDGLSAPAFDLQVVADSLAFEEVARIFPGVYPSGKASMNAAVRGSFDRFDLAVDLSEGPASYHVEGAVDLSGETPAYEAAVRARGVDLARTFPDLGMDAGFDLVGRVKGRGLVWPDVQGELRLGVSHGHFAQAAIDTFYLAADFGDGAVETRLGARGPMGRLSAELKADLRLSMPVRRLSARIERLDLSRIPGGPGVPTDVTGALSFWRAGEADWRARGDFGAVSVGGYSLSGLVFEGVFRDGVVLLERLACDLPPGYGALSGSGRVDLGRFWHSGRGLPVYSLDMGVAGLDPERLTGDARLQGPVSVQARLSGQGLQPDSVSAELGLTFEAPRFLGAGLDSARAVLRQQGRQISLERLALGNALVGLEGNGRATLGDSLVVRLWGRVHDAGRLSELLGVALSGGEIDFTARTGGSWKEPQFALDAISDSLNYEGIPLQEVTLGARWPVLSSGGITLRVGALAWGGRTVRDLFLDAGLEGEELVFLLASRQEDPDRVFLWGRAGSGAGEYRLTLDSLAVQVDRIELANQGPCRLQYRPEGGLQVEQFRLAGPAGRIDAHMHPAQPGAVQVGLSDLDLRLWAFLLGMADGLAGVLDGEVTLAGNLEDPRVSAALDVRGGNVSGFQFEKLAGGLIYEKQELRIDLNLTQSPGREAAFRGQVPMNPFPDGEGPYLLERPMQVALKSEGLDMGFLRALSPEIRAAGGVLSFDLQVGGTPGRPEHDGWLRVRDGRLDLAFLNRTFQPVQALVNFGPDRIVVEQFEVGKSKQGLTVLGNVLLDRYTVGGFDLRLKAGQFELVDLEDLKATLRADLHLTGGLDDPRLEGKAELVRAVIEPYAFIEAPPDPESFWNTSEFYGQLAGKVRLNASRNVWLRGPDLNVEIEGDLDVIKDGEGIRIYGVLNSRRGRYEFRNTSFRIERGELQFQGNVDINPDLYILGTHRLTLINGDPAVISVVVGGTLINPQISFDSEPAMDELNILSYLVLGRPADDVKGLLAGGDGDGAGLNLEGQAADLLLGVAANQLKRTIGRKLNLDLVEIDIGGEDAATRIRVGKYIGSRFFFTYARDISEAGAQEFTVEYELVRSVTLEAQQREGKGPQDRDRQSLGIFWKVEW